MHPCDGPAHARRFGDVLVDMIGKLAADFYPSYCFPWEDDAFILLMSIERDADTDALELHARFSDYVNQAKIHEAQEMIRSGRYRVYEVSDTLFFQAPSEFARRVESKKERDAARKETPKGG